VRETTGFSGGSVRLNALRRGYARQCRALIRAMKPIVVGGNRSPFPSPRASSEIRSTRISTTRLCRGTAVPSNRASARHAALHLLIYPSNFRMTCMGFSSPHTLRIAEKGCVANRRPSVLTHIGRGNSLPLTLQAIRSGIGGRSALWDACASAARQTILHASTRVAPPVPDALRDQRERVHVRLREKALARLRVTPRKHA
jgi:hypothetical protein